MILDPRHILIMGACIDHHTKVHLTEKIDDQIIHDTALLIEHAGVERPPLVLQAINIIGQKITQEFAHALTSQINEGHMRDIKHPRLTSDLIVFFYLRAVV